MAASAAPTTGSNAELIRWAFDVINSHDISPLREHWTPETVERFPDRTCRGGQQIGDYFDALFAALPDVHMEIVHVAEEGDAVFVRWLLSGTHTGTAWSGIEPTGKRIELNGI